MTRILFAVLMIIKVHVAVEGEFYFIGGVPSDRRGRRGDMGEQHRARRCAMPGGTTLGIRFLLYGTRSSTASGVTYS